MRLVTACAVASASREESRPAHDLDEPHDVRRAEKMHADDVGRPPRGRRDRVDVERRSVRREHRPGPRKLAEPSEHLALDRQVLEHRLDHEVRAGDGGERQRALHAAARGGRRRCVEPPLALGRVDRGLHARESGVERFLLRVDERHGDAPGREADRDAGSHGAGAEHGRLADGTDEPGIRALAALGEEQVTQRAATRSKRGIRGTACGSARKRGIRGQQRRACQRLDDPRRRRQATGGGRERAQVFLELRRPRRRHRQVEDAPDRRARARELARPGDGAGRRDRRRRAGRRCRARSPGRCRSACRRS